SCGTEISCLSLRHGVTTTNAWNRNPRTGRRILMKLDRILAVLVLCILFTATVFAQIAPPADLDAWVARSMQTFEVPGLSLAIVKDGKVVVAKGYGVRRLGDPTLVDEHTMFGIGSNTKAFTAACLAILVDEGKIAWDDPVY